ncbi:TPT-domain-containing protein [Fomitiporia mediterranea MF3/22]|uniref:TPT-domain-containing protein n=1 Tax=Fomitiporia mediterranea (strain MF3/22) TaxID=694068 RepID=UPI0004407EC3|nr:TPT-domain-containing protein [Fomitiporia mediterranea MF3/22]EJD07606.1 TPT-domain-containing protein [Fomitiporia mediterranea MF3/22]
MLKFCIMCALWYSASAMSSNTGKAILNQFRFPVTLTFVQFGFVAGYCLLCMNPIVRFSRLRKPTRAILKNTLPMGIFQVGGHMFSSMAISRIPVSTVHTIKALSPLFTVVAYAFLFGVKYSPKTYISLLPLTLGVMLACSFDMSASNALGLTCAFASAIVFVSSNIFFKKVMPTPSSGASHGSTHKLDKLNLLFYSSSMAFLLMIPMWLYYDLPVLLSPSRYVSHPSHGHASPHGVGYYFFINGTVHYGQNIIAFIILSSTSPVTYSIASLFKRVAVICIAILWFNQSVHPVQGFGICLTFAGLWMYNNAKPDVEKGENKMRRVEAAREMILPSTRAEHRMMHASDSPALSDNEGEPISVSSGVERAAYAPPSVAQDFTHGVALPPPPHSQPHSHHNPNLTIKIAPPVDQVKVTESPVDSYPSPPLSNDSPPPSAMPLTSVPEGKSRRRGTISRHVH